MKKEIIFEDFIRTLPFSFSDMELLKKVFVHRSFLNEKNGAGLESNERLEFLGDAILSNVVSHMLYKKHPGIDEGALTRMRARLVNRTALAKLARELCLDGYLLLGKGERMSGGAENPMILAGVFEALIAAVYFHHGFQAAFDYIEAVFGPLIEGPLDEPVHFDFKPRLQELSQRIFKEAPEYRLLSAEGPPHKKTFAVEVIINRKVLGAGSASKKKDAEQIAAGVALKNLTHRFGEFFPDLLSQDNAAHGA